MVLDSSLLQKEEEPGPQEQCPGGALGLQHAGPLWPIHCTPSAGYPQLVTGEQEEGTDESTVDPWRCGGLAQGLAHLN